MAADSTAARSASRTPFYVLGGLLAGVLVVALFVTQALPVLMGDTGTARVCREARDAVREGLRDPDSAVFPDCPGADMWVADADDDIWRVTGHVRARNGFGGYDIADFEVFVFNRDGDWSANLRNIETR